MYVFLSKGPLFQCFYNSYSLKMKAKKKIPSMMN